jgi:hypothetical protein
MSRRRREKHKPKSDSIAKSGGGNCAGAPRYELIEAQRQVFEACLQYGLPVDRLLEAFKIGSIQTFYDILNRDSDLYQRIERARAAASTKVAQTLYNLAVGDPDKGIKPDVGACIWWEKTRSRMRERDLTANEVRDWILNLPYNMREKLFKDLGIAPDALHGTGLVIDATPANAFPTISVNFIESPNAKEGELVGD